MKKVTKRVLVAILTIIGINSANAQSLSDFFSGDLGGTLGNIIEGVFTSSNIDIADLEGEWTITGPAVCFKSDDFLKNAGGLAVASAIETKMSPYYTKYGLTGAKLVIDAEGNYTLQIKNKYNISGTITKSEEAAQGTFDFNFGLLGRKVTSLTTYVQKTSQTMDIMFDASKFKTIISAIANISGMSLAKTISSLLNQYEGLCIGFKLTGGSTQSTNSGVGGLLNGILGGGNSGSNSGTSTTGTSNSGTSNSSTTGTSNSGTTGSGLGGFLNGIFGGGNSGSNSGTSTTGTSNSGTSNSSTTGTGSSNSSNTGTNNSGTSGSGLDLLKGLLNGGNGTKQ
ncbi:MAG: lipocalin-like domain-containing protein [Lepagella sp.]